ncbi:PadR family transcriptional regulator [Uniformispora flossi]|uniref:PadR family transcriptional regulator n=1 Tax=Uniformispora flossi TaxID=3390723 RepID=UPI003C2E7B00
MSLRHALLGLLDARPASGYDLLKTFETSMANVWPATQSQVYGELGRLTDAGLLEVSAEGARGRKEYTITDPGRAELRTWLLAPEPPRPVRSEMLLRVFFLDRIAADQARAYLTAQGAAAEARGAGLAALEESVPWDDGPLSTYGRIALEYGKRQAAMQASWAAWAAAQIPADASAWDGATGGVPAGGDGGGDENGTADRAAENQ